MKLHGNARTCPNSRRLLVERIESRTWSRGRIHGAGHGMTGTRGPAGAIYATSTERTQALPGWLNHYNYIRRHGSPSHKPPGTRLRALTNPPRNYS